MPTSRLTVLFEDNHCLVVAKPAGVLMVGDSTGDVSLLDQAKEYLREKYRKPGNVFLGVVHRLDRPVSGVALFARTSKAAERLSAQFRDGVVQKVYHAWVEGTPEYDSATLTDSLVKNSSTNISRVVEPGTSGARSADLAYRVMKRVRGRSFLEVRPRTGRPHQIRVQLSSRGCPIVGDVKYGAIRCRRSGVIALHAHSLEFLHPTQKEPVVAELPVPSVWKSWFDVS